MKILVCSLLALSLFVGLSITAGEKSSENINDMNIIENDLIEVDIKITNVEKNCNEIKKVKILSNDCNEIAYKVLEEIGVSADCIKDIYVENNVVIIDFVKGSKVVQLGTSGELAILDSLAMTFVEMFNYDNVIFRIDGKNYESGHLYFEIDEVYYDRDK